MANIDSNNNIIVTTHDIRNTFPEFSDETKYPDSLISSFILQAGCYISTQNYGCLTADCRTLLIELMVVHLIYINNMILANSATGGQVGQMASASIDSVSVNMVIPDNSNALKYWLNQSPYGQRYLALLSAHAFPVYLGGSFQRVIRT